MFSVKEDFKPKLRPIVKAHREFVKGRRLLAIPFTTLFDYLWLLRGVCEELDVLASKCLLYLAAAVSDFYIPQEQMVNE